MKVSINWFPNSWILIQWDKLVIYFDPAYLKTYFSKYKDKTEFSSWPNPIDGLPNGLPKGDLVLITHHHKDHCKKVTLERLIHNNTKIYAPKSCKKELGEVFHTVEIGAKIKNELYTISVVNAYNMENSTSTNKQHKKGSGVGYVVDFSGKKIYHAGDTDLIPDMGKLGKIDLAFIPIGGKFTMDYKEAFEATKLVDPKIVIPIHHLKTNPKNFEMLIKEKTNIKCITPKIGEEMNINI